MSTVTSAAAAGHQPQADPGWSDLVTRLREHANVQPERPALSFLIGDAQRQDLTYGQLVARVSAMTADLARQVVAGQRALLLLPAHADFAVAFLGCLAAGVVAVPLPLPDHPSARRRVLAAATDCSPALVISVRAVRESVAGSGSPLRQLCDLPWLLTDVDSIEAAAPSLPARSVSADDLAFLQYTSGSTSAPRGVMITHGGLMANEAAIGQAFDVRSDSTVVSWLPLHHDMGLIGGLLQPLHAGARAVVMDPRAFIRRPVSWLRVISDERADISGAPNFAYDLCVRTVTAAQKHGLDLSRWRVAFNGAAQVFPSTLRAFSEAFAEVGFRATSHVPCYGLAEATLLVTRSGRPEPAVTSFSATALERGRARPASEGESLVRELVGYDLPAHATVRLVDPATGVPVADGQVGELVIAGPSNGAGYWADPVATGATFSLTIGDEPARRYLRTGDLGFLHNGRLYIAGRSKDLIIHHGRNIHPQDIEADVAGSHPATRPDRCAVFSVPQGGDEAVVVCQEVRPGTPASQYPKIADHIRAVVARANEITAQTVVLVRQGGLETTTSGKIMRHDVRRSFLGGTLRGLYVSTLPAPPPARGRLAEQVRAAMRTTAGPARSRAVTAALRAHLRELLGLPEPPPADVSPAALGVDSLMAVRLQNEIEEALGVDLAPTLLLRAGSVREIAERVASAQQVASAQRMASAQPSTASRASDAVPGAAEVGATVGAATPAAGQRPGPELTETQRALWFLQRAVPDSYAYNVTRAFRVVGDPDPRAVASALDDVFARHPSLRLSVHGDDGEPRTTLASKRAVDIDWIDARQWSPEQVADWYRWFATRPFDLARDPLLRAAMLRHTDDATLVLSLHHLVCDLASLSIIVADFAAAYATATGAVVPGDPPAEAGSAELAVTRERAALAADGDRLAAYWQAALAGELPTLSLPRRGTGAEPDLPDRGDGATVPVEVPPGVVTSLSGYARSRGLTLHNVLLAAYQVLLHRLTGQPDLLVGVPTMGRDDRALESWVGYLINTVPVRSAFTPGLGFDELARRTQQTMLDALDHRDLPLSAITRLVNPRRVDPTTSLFQAMFEYYPTALPGGQAAAAAVLGDPTATVPMGPCLLRGQPMPEHTAQSDVSLNVAVTPMAVTFGVQYRTARVSRQHADQLARTYVTLLQAVADDPYRPIGELPLSTAAEIEALVRTGQGATVRRPGHYLESFEQLVERQPAAVAVDDGTVQLTYAELDARANHVAHRLTAEGVGLETRVVLCAQRSADYLVALLGIHKADGCYVPISPTEAPRRAAAMIGAVSPVVCLADQAGRELLSAALSTTDARPPVRDLATVVVGHAQRLRRTSPAAAAAFVIHTSGSTGAPKSVVVTNEGMTNHIWQMLEHLDVGPSDCIAQTAPVSFDISVWQFLAPLAVGAKVRLVPDPAAGSPAGLLRAVLAGGVSVLELVPSMIMALLDAGLATEPGALRAMISTGDSLTHDVADRWRHALPHIPLYNAYGPAECSDDVTMGLCAHGPDTPVSWSIGRPLANTSVLVLDDNLMPVPVGVVGTLCVGGTAVGRGYLGDPRRTAEVFVPDPWSPVPGARMYVTGDLGRLRPDGTLEFLGRDDTQIKLRGVRIEASEVEAAIRAHPTVADAVVKVEVGASGAVLVGYVVLGGEGDGSDGSSAHPGGSTQHQPAGRWRPEELQTLDPAEDRALRETLRQRLPRQMIPTIFVQLPRLPRSANGKLDLGALDHTRIVTSPADSGDDPDDPLSATIRAIWAELLGHTDLGWRDSFFSLGGHSLLALTMLDKVNQGLGVELDVDTVFANPRLCDFAELVRQADRRLPAGGGAVPAGGPAVAVPASSAQQRFWFLHELAPGQPTYNMPGVLRLRGVLDEPGLQAALRETLERHPVLRARFRDREGGLTWTAAATPDEPASRVDLRGVLAELGDEAFEQYLTREAARPFDLRREPPFRAALARLAADEWALLVTIDHIACDGVSLSIFLADLSDAYRRRIRGGTQPPAVRHTFADYCRAEQAWLASADRSAMDADEWREAVVHPVVRSPLPSHAGASSGRNDRHVTWLEPKLAGEIRQFAGDYGVTPFIVFATALSALVHSGADQQETVLLGTLVAQRDRAAWQQVVGPLLNVSVLATRLAPIDTGVEALRRTRDSALRAYRSRNLPFQELARLLRPVTGDSPATFRGTASPGSGVVDGRDPDGDRAPFELMLVMQPTTAVPQLEGLATSLTELEPDGAPYPLTVDIAPWDDGYQFTYRFASDRYQHDDVEALATRLLDATAMLVRAPHRTVGEILRAAGSWRSG